jgi:hypothetical protein
MTSRRTLIIVLMASILAAPLAAQPPRTGRGEVEQWRTLVQQLEPAAFVSVKLADGSTLKGTVLAASADSFTLKPRTRIAVPARDLRYGEVVSLERARQGMNSGTKVLVGVGASVGAFLVIVLATLAHAD